MKTAQSISMNISANRILPGAHSALCLALLWSGSARAQAPATAPAPVAAPAPGSPNAPAAAPTGAEASATWQTPPADSEVPDTNTATMNHNLSAFGAIGFGYGYGTGYGLGARYQIVFASHVLKLPPGKHDEFGVEFGLDYYHVSYGYSALGSSYNWSYNEFTPTVGVTWNFWLTDRLAVYPKLDFGYRFVSWNNDLDGYDADVGHIYFQGTGGVIYDLGPVKLRAELGWVSLRFGAAIALL